MNRPTFGGIIGAGTEDVDQDHGTIREEGSRGSPLVGVGDAISNEDYEWF